MASPERSEQAGLVVVGASAAGLVAAITAADHGHRVVLVERTKELGGLAATSPESIAAAGTRFQRVADVADAPERLLADIQRSAGADDADVAAAVAAQGASLVEWLADRCGVQVTLQSTSAIGGHSAPRLHAVGDQGGASLLTALARAASHHTHIRLRVGTEVERLLPTDEGGVAGVAVRGDRRAPTVVRGPVLLSCGSYVGDDGLVAQHCPHAADVPYLGPAGAKGDAIRLATPLGATLRHASSCIVTPLLAQPSHLAVTRATLGEGAILVNQRGERFGDATASPLALAKAVRGQPGRLAYLLFDERVAAAVGAHDPFFARVVLPRTARRAGSTGMLAKQLELPEATLASTLRSYERLAEPYYGVRVTGGRRTTRGGLAVDRDGRVLDGVGNAVPHLYAAGGAAAGIGVDADLRGVGTLVALALGRLAALGLGVVADEG